MANKTGYEPPQHELQDDFLGRWRFAADVFRVANETPKDWSVRLGISAKWGKENPCRMERRAHGQTRALRAAHARGPSP
jgi:hypothetical protein